MLLLLPMLLLLLLPMLLLPMLLLLMLMLLMLLLMLLLPSSHGRGHGRGRGRGRGAVDGHAHAHGHGHGQSLQYLASACRTRRPVVELLPNCLLAPVVHTPRAKLAHSAWCMVAMVAWWHGGGMVMMVAW
jgi:hypothetical protein